MLRCALVIKGDNSSGCDSVSEYSILSGAFCAAAILFAFSKKSVNAFLSRVPSSVTQDGEEEEISVSKRVELVMLPSIWLFSELFSLSFSAANASSSRLLISSRADCRPMRTGMEKLVGTARSEPSVL